MPPILFLDRDGTINVEKHFLFEPEAVELVPGVKEALIHFKNSGYLLALVTNQSGIARGYYSLAQMHSVHHRIEKLLELSFDTIQYCPHHPSGTVLEFCFDCECRKPKPGLITMALNHFNMNKIPEGSFLVGDTLRDCLAAQAMGLPSFLLGNATQPMELPTGCKKVPSWSHILNDMQRR